MTLRNTALLACLALPLLTACGDDDDTGETGDTGDTAVSEVDFSVLSKEMGCSDLYLAQVDPAGSLMLEVSYDAQLTELSYNSGATESLTIDLATAGSVVLTQGEQLQKVPCNDAIDGTVVVDKQWTAVSGTVEFSFTSNGGSDGDEYGGDGQVTLTNVVLELDGAQLSVPDRSWTAYAGWLPG